MRNCSPAGGDDGLDSPAGDRDALARGGEDSLVPAAVGDQAGELAAMRRDMVPPVVVSLPLKLAFFVLADGWGLLAGALVRSYAP